uniref:Uncharacterized protein n=1 Tax=viral metagenome TaxID=1070528 RepID=A0A6M3L561_9ZZZZ
MTESWKIKLEESKKQFPKHRTRPFMNNLAQTERIVTEIVRISPKVVRKRKIIVTN